MAQAGLTSQPDPSHQKRSLLLVAAGSVIAIVVIAAVLSQVLYGVFSGPHPPPERVAVTFANPYEVTDGFEFAVMSVSQLVNPGNFRVNLRVDSVAGTPAVLALTVPLTVNGSSYTIVWVDPGGERTLTGGDRFQIVRSGGLPLSTFTFSLLWSDASVIQTQQYVARAVITLGSPIAITDGFEFSVAGASRSAGPAYYKVDLRANSTLGTAVPMAASMTITVGGNTYSLAWIDIGGDATLNPGDRFRVALSGGLPASTVFTFMLLWSDGFLIQNETYTT